MKGRQSKKAVTALGQRFTTRELDTIWSVFPHLDSDIGVFLPTRLHAAFFVMHWEDTKENLDFYL